MRITSKIFIVLTLTFVAGCAYYNTFFNAKKFYKEAEKSRLKDKGKDDEPNNAAKQKYQQAIEKASRLLEYYPRSKYVDDALFLLGKSFFYREEYQSAKRKFEEIINNFPTSEFIPDARLWLGKTNTELEDYDTAEKNFQDITIFKARQAIIDEAQYLLGGLHFNKEDYISALNEYKLAAQNAKDKALRSQAYYQMGECYLKLHDYTAAVSSFEKAKKYSTDSASEFNAQFKAGLTRKDLKQYDEAIANFLDLLGNISNEDNWPKCKLEVASCLYLKGEISNAIFWYETITEEHKRTEQAATAYFNLGVIYQRDKADYTRAKDYFELAVKEFSRASIIDAAKANSKNIQNLLALKADIKEQEKRIARGDSVAAAMDSIDIDTSTYAQPIDSTHLQPAPTYADGDSTGVPDDSSYTNPFERREENLRRTIQQSKEPVTKKVIFKTGELGTPHEELIKDKIMLAEIYLFDFDQPDSALAEYLDVIDKDTTESIVSKAIYSIGFIFEKYKNEPTVADSIYGELIGTFPNTIYADQARQRLKLPRVAKEDDLIKSQFIQAEKLYLDVKRYDLALNQYEKIADNHPQSPFASKALYSMGWIYDYELEQNDKALSVYQKLVDKYPETEYATVAKKKIDAFQKSLTAGDKAKTQSVTPGEATEEETELAQAEQKPSDDSAVEKSEKLAFREMLRQEMAKDDRRLKNPRRIIK